MKNNQIITYDISKKHIQFQNSILISKYILSTTPRAFLKLYKTNIENLKNLYIMCIGYIAGDYQIGFTGTTLYGEKLFNTLNREAQEEIGINILDYEDYTQDNNEKNITFIIPIRKCNYNQTIFDYSNDNSKQYKVGGLIYGNYSDMIYSLNHLFERPDSEETQSITSLSLISFKHIYNILSEMKLYKSPFVYIARN